MQQKPIGDDPDKSGRPMLPDQRYECRKVWIDRGLAAKKNELVNNDSSAPLVHPASRHRRVKIASMTMI